MSTWLIVFLVHLIFSTTFLTSFSLGLLINARIRQYILIWTTWCLWLLGSFLFSLGRVMLGLYHIFRISVNIILFIWSSLLLRLSLWIRSFHTTRDELYYRLERSDSYDEWFSIGVQLDEICGGNEWRAKEETDDYQWIYLKEYIFRLREARKCGNLKKLVFLLRWCCDRNFASISKQGLYNKAFSGTKKLIDEFEEEIESVFKFLIFCSKSQELSGELDSALSDRSAFRFSPDQVSRSNSIERLISFSKESSVYSGNSAANNEEGSLVDFCLGDEDEGEGLSIDEIEVLLSEENKENSKGDVARADGSNKFFEREHESGLTGDGLGDYNSHKDVHCSPRSIYFGNRELRNASISSDFKRMTLRDTSVQTCNKCLGESGPCIGQECSSTEREAGSMLQGDGGSGWSSDCGLHTELRDEGNLQSLYSFETGTGSALTCSRGESTITGNNLIHYLEILGHSTGKTALCLSGGGALAMYHLGVVKVLLEQNIMPKIINGTSGGSIVAALLATKSDREILSEYIKPTVSNMHGQRWFPPLLDQIRHFLVKGYMIDPKDFIRTCQTYFKNYTFYEAYKLTGRIVTITVSPTHITTEFAEPLVLNCVTTPDILIWSAVAASCALPGLMPVAELFAKENHTNRIIRYFPPGMKWMDGSISQDIPHKELSTLFNVRQFIVSQVNPHHAPFVSINPTNTSIFHPERTFLQNVLNWLTLDIKYRYTKLAKLKLIPKLFGKDVSNFWMLQEIEGHVTIAPRVSLFDWYRCINHPSYNDMLHFITEGERRTWPHVMRIRHMNFLERTIKQAVRNIKYGDKTK
ncbi:signal peptide-containing and transmembrane domain-containing protein [Cryptosporidium canis]|uniref:Signal peptide-containing and transmembrane domain-containing protein n=1 Tax=Cryptosporidium canis TaxID=195482 RepID=A0A9D5DHB2_9CRYT|nr:signal peptide-containing and transmembrane domain-containing protein [Cryptosporidium canis]